MVIEQQKNLACLHSLLSSPSLKNTETRTNIKTFIFFIYIVGYLSSFYRPFADKHRECYAVLMEKNKKELKNQKNLFFIAQQYLQFDKADELKVDELQECCAVLMKIS